jgi:hypothetical protein
MSAYIGVFEHPFFAVTKDDGTFAIKTEGLPDGEYTVQLWHEKYASDDANPVTMKVKVDGGKGELNHAFKAEAAMAEPAIKTVILASSDGEKKDCDGSACCKTDKVARKSKDAKDEKQAKEDKPADKAEKKDDKEADAKS